MYQDVVKAVKNDAAEASVVSKVLDFGGSGIYEKNVVTKTALQMVTGGADTTVSALSSFVLAMLLHPKIQKKAQAEIDRVVGQDRLATFHDRQSLPYVDAVMKEILRCYPPVPATSRNTTQDDVYEGYHIPQGTVVIMNCWAMLHDERTFQDPMTFNPDRWLNTAISKYNDPLDIAFGFGKRICPGKQLGVELLFSSIAGILSLFDIRNAEDEGGNLIIPTGEYTNGSISSPVPFECSIKLRSGRVLTEDPSL